MLKLKNIPIDWTKKMEEIQLQIDDMFYGNARLEGAEVYGLKPTEPYTKVS